MFRFLPWIFGGLLLLAGVAAKSEEEKIQERIHEYEGLLRIYEKADTEQAYLICADIRDYIELLKQKLQLLKSKQP